MRISDWSSDVCSSDLFLDAAAPCRATGQGAPLAQPRPDRREHPGADGAAPRPLRHDEIWLALRTRGLHPLSGAERARSFSRRFRRSRATHRSSGVRTRSEEHTSELQSLMRISYAVFCLKKKRNKYYKQTTRNIH